MDGNGKKKFVLVSNVPETPMQVQVQEQAPAQLAVMVENPAGNGIGTVEQIKLINPPPNWREISSTNPSLTYAKGEELFVACVSRSCGPINCFSVVILEKNAMLWESAVISIPLPGDCCNAEYAETDKDALAAILSVFRERLSPFINLVNSKGFRPRAPYGVFWNSSSSRLQF
ncbi:uncharacterized protein LOC135848015 [Planococcus citri]|uniref:uncharacterized protein LOC135848015 n=1 Tax=Planococcus citri TaxID=170843 RepID=UPI0031F889DC